MEEEKVVEKFPVVRLEVSVESVFPNKWNPNIQTDLIFKKLVETIKQIGFIDSVLVREIDEGAYEIIDGEHRLKAAQELGYKKVTIDNLGKIDDSRAKALTVIMNNTRGQDDILKRAQILKEIESGQLSLLPFDEKQIEEEIKLLDFDFSQFEVEDIEDEDKERAKKILQTCLSLERLLRQLHNSSKNVKLKLLIEQYFEWVKVFQVSVDK